MLLTHTVRTDYLNKVIRMQAPVPISQIQCVLQPGLFWSRKTCTVHICCCISHLSDKSSSLGNYEDWESGVGTKSKSIMLLQVDGVLSNGFISTPVLSTPLTTITLSPDFPSESRSLEQTVSYPSLGREAVGPPPSPPLPPRCWTGWLPSGNQVPNFCRNSRLLRIDSIAPDAAAFTWLYSFLSSQVTPLLWWAWLLQLSRVVSLLMMGVAPRLPLDPIASFPGLLIWERGYTCPAQCLMLECSVSGTFWS